MAKTCSIQSLPLKNEWKITYLPTTVAYDRWAAVYDHDANPLQALDDLELTTLLPEFLGLIRGTYHESITTIVDLGCGTGRNTLKLLSLTGTRIVGLDASPKMLEIARKRCMERLDALPESAQVERMDFEVFDMLEGTALPESARNIDAIVSTLVLEHIPLPDFFSTVAKIMSIGGYLLVTNMHSEMGSRSQAGFVDPKTGEKVRPESWAHGVEEVLAQAAAYGFRVVGEVRERTIMEEDLSRLGRRAQKWVGVRCWFGIVFEKL